MRNIFNLVLKNFIEYINNLVLYYIFLGKREKKRYKKKIIIYLYFFY